MVVVVVLTTATTIDYDHCYWLMDLYGMRGGIGSEETPQWKKVGFLSRECGDHVLPEREEDGG